VRHFPLLDTTIMESTTASRDAQFIPADDDEFDESSMPAFSGAALPVADASPVSNSKKGKVRAEAMPIPSSSGAGGSAGLSGKIGSVPLGVKPALRQTVGGVQVETRFVRWWRSTSAGTDLSLYSKICRG
jgi:protein YIPF6